jgi:carbon-monoxide dehydrogenase medium subunit
MKPFEYLEPVTLREALTIKDQCGAEGKVLAGGTDLIVQLKQKLIEPRYVINLKKIDELDYAASNGKGLDIGPLMTLSSIGSSEIIRGGFCMVSEASRAIGTPQVRNIGTIGGNICHGSPSADLSPALMALRAELKVKSVNGERILPIEKFFIGPYETCLAPNELVVGIHIPSPPTHSAGTYLWLPKCTSVDETLVGCAVWVSLEAVTGQIEDVKIGLGAVAPTPMRAVKTENFLRGKGITENLFEKAGEIASAESKPIARFGFSDAYRKEMVRILVIRGLKKVIEILRVDQH